MIHLNMLTHTYIYMLKKNLQISPRPIRKLKKHAKGTNS